jgi:hypothetical protein
MTSRTRLSSLIVCLATFAARAALAAQPNVVSTNPAANDLGSTNQAISVTFDTALAPGTVDSSTFRVFGKYSGTAAGTLSLSNGDKTVTFSPTGTPFRAGEFVLVNLSHDITASDNTPMRAAGYAFQFIIAAQPSGMVMDEIQSFSNTGGPQTRIYGAMAGDLDNDGFIDLMTVNEVSADVRVFLNLADGSGQFDENWLAPQAVGVESSPNESADFDNDGNIDAAVSATDDHEVTILLGAGDGSFSSTQFVDLGIGSEPHGIAVLDVDGDADMDIVDANRGGDEIALLINDGSGTFGAPTYFDGDVSGEYGLAAADMNGDGITDVVAGGIDSQEICTSIGNGNGTFTPTTPQDSGGLTWVIVLGDIDGDLDLDAAIANSTSANIATVKNNGNGTFTAPDEISIGFHVPSIDVNDLNGDGDIDIVLSSFGGGFWQLYENDGAGNFSFVEETPALSSPSCAVLYDGDNDGDVDAALTDEIADVVKIFENGDGTSLCPPAPDTCRTAESGKSSLSIKDDGDDPRDRFQFKFNKGQTTPKSDYNDPNVSGGEDYELCVYRDDGMLIMNRRAPAGGTCAGKDCWTEKPTSFGYKDKGLTPDGIESMKLSEGLSDGTKIQVKGRGGQIAIPNPLTLNGTITVQLQQESGLVCWGATFTQPYLKQDIGQLKARSD